MVGGKVGGIGDVVRDVPPVLARVGWQVQIATPSDGFLHQIAGSTLVKAVVFPFGGSELNVNVYVVPGKNPHPGVASKYALFCAAVAEALRDNLFQKLDCIYLHDWHAACLLILRKYHPRYEMLKQFRMAYTIHNLALQGVRPFSAHSSSLASWYPEVPLAAYAEIADPRWPNCLNLMAVGIRLAEVVHAVSRCYASGVSSRSTVLPPIGSLPHPIYEGQAAILACANDEEVHQAGRIGAWPPQYRLAQLPADGERVGQGGGARTGGGENPSAAREPRHDIRGLRRSWNGNQAEDSAIQQQLVNFVKQQATPVQ